MLITFIGSPASGKTTTASMTFARLKEAGLPVEFVPEYARLYIAEARIRQGLSPHELPELTDHDQGLILAQQLEWEDRMSRSCGDRVIVISDTAALNSLLYMSDGARKSPTIKALLGTRANYSLVFYSTLAIKHVAAGGMVADPNRVHGLSDSLLIDGSIPAIMKEHAPEIWPAVVRLEGPPELRVSAVLSEIYRLLPSIGG